MARSEDFSRMRARSISCRGRTLHTGRGPVLMGILNVTPDSFSDGGRYLEPAQALAQTERLIAAGADILDIGAESTRPGHNEVSAAEEWARLEPVLKPLLARGQVPISVDTQKAEVAREALAAGVHILNDIWGLQKDPAMAEAVQRFQPAVVVMHNRQEADSADSEGDRTIEHMLAFLGHSVDIALAQGLAREQIIVDPGIGFGKTVAQNLAILRRLSELRMLGCPVLLGVSRKSVIQKTLNIPAEDALAPTIALNVLGLAAGADIFRVHDIEENKRALLMTAAVLGRG